MSQRPAGLAPTTAAPPPPIAPPLPLSPRVGRRRLLSLSSLALLPGLGDAIGTEARLWREEAALYWRRAAAALSLDGPAALPPASSLRLDAEFAAALLAALRVPLTNAASTQAYVEEYRRLRERELPYFQEAGTCGHCGTAAGPAGLTDRSYFDFESYVGWKALFEVSRPVGDDAGDGAGWRGALRLRVGEAVLQHVLKEVDLGDAEAGAISPIRPSGSDDALLSASPELDSIRRGVTALLRYFRKKGFVGTGAVSQFGLSADEFENHMTWARGEPAFLKYWLASPADLRAGTALSDEEGAGVSFVAAAVAAYLERCGVRAEDLRRIPSLSDPSLVAEQWTLRRVKPLAKGGKLWERGYLEEWRPDACPGGGTGECY